MPGLLRSSKSGKDSGWVHTLRGDIDSDSSDDDSKNDNRNRVPCKPPTETQLLKELDISSRDALDTVEFKANPWRIAKMNAAARPTVERRVSTHSHPAGLESAVPQVAEAKASSSSTVGTKGQTKIPAGSANEGNSVNPRGSTIDKFFSSGRPNAPSAHNGRLPSKTILDGSLRMQPALRSNAGIISEHPRSNVSRTVEAGTQGNRKSYTRSRGAIASNPISVARPSTTEVLLLICAEEFNCNDRSPTETYKESSKQSDAMIGDKVLFQNVPNGTLEGTSATNFMKDAFSSPMKSPNRGDFKQHPAGFFSKFLPSRSQKSSPPPDVLRYNHGRSGATHRQISSFSSPPRDSKSGTDSVLSGRSSLGLPSSRFGSRTLTSQQPRGDDLALFNTRPHSTCQTSVNANLSTMLPLHDGQRTNEHLSVPQDSTNDTYANYNTYDNIEIYPDVPVRKPSAESKHLTSNISKLSKFEDTHIDRRRRDNCSPVLNQGLQSRAVRKYDAYSAFPDDEDAWSTLPARKKPQKKASSGSFKQSGRFRLPLALGNLSSNNSDTVDNGESQTIKKRKVATYLPPPKRRRSNSEPPQDSRQRTSNVNDVTVGSKHDGALEPANRSVTKWSIKRLNGKFAYRGPNHEEALPTASEDHQHLTQSRHRSTANDRNNFRGSALSDQLSATNSDPCLPCDEHRIIDSYSQVRRAIADRKAANRQVWDILGLQSCGVVFTDTEQVQRYGNGGQNEECREMRIVEWGGR